jgi:hypothetical protein
LKRKPKNDSGEERAPTDRRNSGMEDPNRIVEITEEMELDQDGEEPGTQQTLDNEPNDENADAAKKSAKKKLSAAMPKVQKGMKVITEALKTPDPVATIEHQLRRDMAGYFLMMQVSHAIEKEFLKATLPGTELRRIRDELDPGFRGTGGSITEVAPVQLEANFAGFDMKSLLRDGNVKRSPRINVELNLKG